MSQKRFGSVYAGNVSKVSRKSIPLSVKIEVLRRVESGERQAEVGRSLNLATSTIRTIVKNADKIKASAKTATPLTASKLTRSRSSLLENMESRLSSWVEDQQQHHMPLSQLIIMKKARSIFTYLQEHDGEGSRTETFTASRGWFARFKRRINLHNLRTGVSVDEKTAWELPSIIKTIIERSNYPPQLVFNVDETGLYWKRMPSRTFIAREEKLMPGFKAAKDRLTLLLGGNASGDFKLKPMLLYRSETPRAMKGFSKEHLPVIWKSNRKALMTIDIFQQWFVSYFCPAVKRYCEEHNLEPKALLVLDNAPGHPENLDSLRTCIPVEVLYLPPNTTSLAQPMNQGVISNFKAYYLRSSFKQLVEEIDDEDMQSICEFWKAYNIMKAIDNIKIAWDEVTSTCMNSAWWNLWPEIVRNDLMEFEPSVAGEIVQLANQAGMDEVDIGDVEELLQSHENSLTNEELQDLEQQRLHEENDDNTGEETSIERNLSTAIMTEGITKIREALELFSENDPDWERSNTMKRIVLNGISCYREMLREKKLRERQAPLDTFFKKEPE